MSARREGQAISEESQMPSIESTDIPDAYVKAYQANIYIKRYPMVRDLNYILKENYKGLGNAFANFMSGEIGQMTPPPRLRFGLV